MNGIRTDRAALARITALFAALAASAACPGDAGDTDAADDVTFDIEGDADIGDDGGSGTLPYPIVDTAQDRCYGTAATITCADRSAAFGGQDAQYVGNPPRYRDNGDGTVSDLVTGLMWQRDSGAVKKTFPEAVAGADALTLAGYDDWRLPTIKELFSLIDFRGTDPSGYTGTDASRLVPFIDDGVFVFRYGDTSADERIIDSQWATSTTYVSGLVPEMVFGVNFADGRIKGYETTMPGGRVKTFFVIYVRGNPDYGVNDLVDNGDGTVADRATGLVWQQDDGGSGMSWEAALAYCENLALAGRDDWRLPNAKELQSIVDYSRSPDTTGSAAIDPLFRSTAITNEAGAADYPFYWSSTTHANWTASPGASAAYVSFGRALGYMDTAWRDVHGAGAQRSDPKIGDPADYPYGHGPQGDAIRIFNFARCVREGVAFDPGAGGADAGADADATPDAPPDAPDADAGGPAGCTTSADCLVEGACPPDAAMGCDCLPVPGGDACVPLCRTSADCPAPPGMTLVCGPEDFCVPG